MHNLLEMLQWLTV